MRQFVTSGEDAVARGLAAFGAAHADLVRVHHDPVFVTRAEAPGPKVALLSGGGSGHEPLHAGFVGTGMLDAAVPGQVFASPSAEQVHRATVAADTGRGVLHIVKNYTGDVINFSLAADLARADGVDVATVIVDDDVASGPRGGTPGRRGVAGTVVVEKVCGAAAERGMPLAELVTLGERVVDATRSIGVAAEAGTAFGAERGSFDLAADEVEFGVGIHGERSVARSDLAGIDELCRAMVDAVLDDLSRPAEELLVLINGLGRTTPLELYAAYGALAGALADRGARIARAMVGDLVTSLDMRGFSLTVSALSADEWALWDAPARTPAWVAPSAQPPAPIRGAASRGDEASAGDEAAGGDGAAGGDDVAGATAAAIDTESPVNGALARWIDRFVDRADAAADDLGELDRLAGDGDFGSTLRTVLRRYRAAPATGSAAPTGSALKRLSEVYSGIGGSSGPLLSAWLLSLDTAVQAGGFTPAALSDGLARGLARVQQMGAAEVGDKTMVDAMAPAAAAIDPAGTDVVAALAAAAAAAQQGADSTVGMTARRGRASYVGEAAGAVADPGAMLIALFLHSGAEVIAAG